MSFADNLRQLRKQQNYSQEELAELLDVSRQAVSKWEQGTGYPETEKLLLLSRVLDASLDDIMDTKFAGRSTPQPKEFTGKILITSPNENIVVSCKKVAASGKMPGGKHEPKYALFGVSDGVNSFWGEPTTFLGWYADNEAITKEIKAIQKALVSGIPNYDLQFSVKTERRWMRIRIVQE